MFSAPGSTAQERSLVAESGFASKWEAGDAEAMRRAQELQKYELAKASATTVAPVHPTTLAMLLQEFPPSACHRAIGPQDNRAISGVGRGPGAGTDGDDTRGNYATPS
jgi:hypothetical protein